MKCHQLGLRIRFWGNHQSGGKSHDPGSTFINQNRVESNPWHSAHFANSFTDYESRVSESEKTFYIFSVFVLHETWVLPVYLNYRWSEPGLSCTEYFNCMAWPKRVARLSKSGRDIMKAARKRRKKSCARRIAECLMSGLVSSVLIAIYSAWKQRRPSGLAWSNTVRLISRFMRETALARREKKPFGSIELARMSSRASRGKGSVPI